MVGLRSAGKPLLRAGEWTVGEGGGRGHGLVVASDDRSCGRNECGGSGKTRGPVDAAVVAGSSDSDPSHPLGGRGLFRHCDAIPAGAAVLIMCGRIATDAEAKAHSWRYRGNRAIQIDDDVNLLQTSDDASAALRHSCDPNVWFADRFTFGARRDIEAGDELTVDHATFTVDPDWVMPCSCGSAACRGSVSGDDWSLPALQGRYARSLLARRSLVESPVERRARHRRTDQGRRRRTHDRRRSPSRRCRTHAHHDQSRDRRAPRCSLAGARRQRAVAGVVRQGTRLPEHGRCRRRWIHVWIQVDNSRRRASHRREPERRWAIAITHRTSRWRRR